MDNMIRDMWLVFLICCEGYDSFIALLQKSSKSEDSYLN